MNNRRSFMASLAGFFGFGTATVVASEPASKLDGFITFYLNIGSLPPYKAEAFISRHREQWKKDETCHNLIKNWQVFWIPTRTQETHAEFFPINGSKDAEGRLQQIEGMMLEYEDKASHPGSTIDIDDPLLNLKAVDCVMLMLGAPVVNVDQVQVEYAYNNVVEHIKNTGNAVNSMYLTDKFVKDGTLAWAKMFIGRIRIKEQQHGSDDALVLYEEGRDEVANWLDELQKMM